MTAYYISTNNGQFKLSVESNSVSVCDISYTSSVLPTCFNYDTTFAFTPSLTNNDTQQYMISTMFSPTQFLVGTGFGRSLGVQTTCDDTNPECVWKLESISNSSPTYLLSNAYYLKDVNQFLSEIPEIKRDLPIICKEYEINGSSTTFKIPSDSKINTSPYKQVIQSLIKDICKGNISINKSILPFYLGIQKEEPYQILFIEKSQCSSSYFHCNWTISPVKS